VADANTEELTRRREAIRQEISTIREAIVDVGAPEGGQTQIDKLQNLEAFLAIRERELNDVEAQLARRA
jgi:hypothetical protein